MGWANHRANRLVDLATLTFRTASEHNSARRRGDFGCTAPKVATQILQKQKKRADERTPTRKI